MATRYTGRLSLRTLVALACALPFALLCARPAGAQAVYDPMADARSNPALVVYANLGAEKAKGEDHLAIKAAVEALAHGTEEFAARRMDRSVHAALAGKKLDEVS